MPLTKYVSVTFTGGSNDGSTSNPYTTLEDARADIQSNASDNGPHYIILSESSATTTVYSASYGMPSGFEQEFWMGSYNRGVIVSGAHGQDIIIDGGGVTNKSALEFYGSGSGAHNLTIRNLGNNSNPNYGALRFTKRPASVKGVTISGSICGGITMLGDHSDTGAWTKIDSCRIHMGSPASSRRAIDWGSHARYALVNNCLVVFAGGTADGTTPSSAIGADYGTSYTTASFCTVVISVKDTLHTDSGIGIVAGEVKNCIVSMSLAHDSNDVVAFISADTATNNLYAGWNTASEAAGIRRTFNGTSASFGATDLSYRNSVALTLFNDPDPEFLNLQADWTLAAGSPALDAGTALTYFTGLTATDLSGTSRADPPDIGAFEFVSTGYGNTVVGVATANMAKVLNVTKANLSKVVGT